MELQNNNSSHTTAGTIGGTMLIVLLQVNTGQLVQTIVLAAIGAVVSFGTSLLCKKLFKRISRKSIGDKR